MDGTDGRRARYTIAISVDLGMHIILICMMPLMVLAFDGGTAWTW